MIHSVPFCTNMIHWRLSHSIAHCHVVIHSVPSHPDRIHHLLSCSIAIQLLSVSFCPNLIHSLPSYSIVFISSHHISCCIIVFWSIPFQAFLVVFIISYHVIYRNLHRAIHSVTFRPNMIFQIISHSIEYFQVAIYSVPIRHNRIHHILSCYKEKIYVSIPSVPFCTILFILKLDSFFCSILVILVLNIFSVLLQWLWVPIWMKGDLKSNQKITTREYN